VIFAPVREREDHEVAFLAGFVFAFIREREGQEAAIHGRIGFCARP
jgi:hypothetical protein